MVTPRQTGRVGVQVVCVAGGRGFSKDMLVPVGQTVGWCVNASGVVGLFPDVKNGKVGVWGKLVKPETVLMEGDRVEVYLPCLPEALAKARKIGRKIGDGGIVKVADLGDNVT